MRKSSAAERTGCRDRLVPDKITLESSTRDTHTRAGQAIEASDICYLYIRLFIATELRYIYASRRSLQFANGRGI